MKISRIDDMTWKQWAALGVIGVGTVVGVKYFLKSRKKGPSGPTVVEAGTGYIAVEGDETPRLVDWQIFKQGSVFAWRFKLRPDQPAIQLGEVSSMSGESLPMTFGTADEAYNDLVVKTNLVPTLPDGSQP